jgi:hypothetical protein
VSRFRNALRNSDGSEARARNLETRPKSKTRVCTVDPNSDRSDLLGRTRGKRDSPICSTGGSRRGRYEVAPDEAATSCRARGVERALRLGAGCARRATNRSRFERRYRRKRRPGAWVRASERATARASTTRWHQRVCWARRSCFLFVTADAMGRTAIARSDVWLDGRDTHVNGILVVRRGIVTQHAVGVAGLEPRRGVGRVRLVIHRRCLRSIVEVRVCSTPGKTRPARRNPCGPHARTPALPSRDSSANAREAYALARPRRERTSVRSGCVATLSLSD